MTSNLAFYQVFSSIFSWLYLLLLLCNIDLFHWESLSTISHPYYDLPTHCICLSKTFSILRFLYHIFLLLIQFPIKLSLKHSVLFKPIYPFLIHTNFCCNSYNPPLQSFNNNSQCFYSNNVFSF